MSVIGFFIWVVFGVYGFLMTLHFDVEDDVKKWRSIQEVLHRRESILRAIHLTMPIGVFVMLKIHAGLHWFFALALCLGLLSSWYWTLFDGMYNEARGFDWWFPGSPNGKKDDSVMDKFLRRFPKYGRQIIKISYILIATTLYIVC